MGIDYRIVNGYVYISGNPVTDPEKIAERATFFQRRAGHYFENWNDLYEGFKKKMEVLIEEITNLPVPDLPEYEPDEVMERDDKNTRYVEVLDAYQRTLRCGDLMWQHHFEFLLLGYGAYLTFADLCKQNLPDIPDQHIAQMVAGIDVLLFRPDAELRRLARLALETGVDGAFAEGRTAGRDRGRAGEERRGPRLAGGPRAHQGPLVQHGDRRRPLPLLPQLARRPGDPVRVADRLRRRAEGRRGGRAPDRGDPRRARPARRGVRRAAPRRGAHGVRRPSRPLAHGLPVRRGAQVLLRLLVPDALVEQGARVRRAARAARLPRGPGGRVPARPPRGRRRARRAAADLGDRRHPARTAPLAADRRPPARAAAQARRVDAAAGDRGDARGDHRPGRDHALGRDHAARPGVGARGGRRHGADGRRGGAGARSRAPRAS